MPNLESSVYYNIMVWSVAWSFVTLTLHMFTYGQKVIPTRNIFEKLTSHIIILVYNKQQSNITAKIELDCTRLLIWASNYLN